jgi:hypothetical protein
MKAKRGWALGLVVALLLVLVASVAWAGGKDKFDWLIADKVTELGGGTEHYSDLTMSSGDINLTAGSAIYHDDATSEGVVFAAYIDTAYGTTTTAAITIPASADVVDWAFIVTTAYNDSGTDVMTCGSAADADKYVDDLDVSSAGRNMALDAADMQQDEATWGNVGSSNLAVNCVYTGQNANASAGAGKFIIWWRLD